MTFQQQLEHDATIFLNPNEFAEIIRYIPKNSDEKIIDALIIQEERHPASGNQGRSLENEAELYIAKTDLSSIDRRDDRILIRDKKGIERRAKVNEILSSDSGLWHLKVGW